MPTPLDHAMKSRNSLLAFGGLVTAVAVWAVYGGDMFPREGDPTGSPEDWSREDMRRWLSARNLFPGNSATREELLARIQANLRIPRAQ
ncbi:hypothetical protein B0T11DRAFT_285336 [Plectosphaerella cucumerina]|uniref:STE24 endopeptidase n=1 Tax=Plectosphaerella cucumerina TaxID=40658 RepID=A0A8K0TI86_9PEZI|nr:hypothetical protein B0T11DRAFT_285336 [Plectosphaerella cucumerina]